MFVCNNPEYNGMKYVFLGRYCIVNISFADLNNITRASFDPQPPANIPVVIPIDGKYEISCALPEGLPPPLLRY